MLARLHAHMQKDMRQVAVNMYESLWKLGGRDSFLVYLWKFWGRVKLASQPAVSSRQSEQCNQKKFFWTSVYLWHFWHHSFVVWILPHWPEFKTCRHFLWFPQGLVLGPNLFILCSAPLCCLINTHSVSNQSFAVTHSYFSPVFLFR